MPDRRPLPTDDPTPRIEAAFVARIGAARYNLWFPPNARFVWLGHELVVAARNAHFQDWAADKFRDALAAAVAETCGDGRPVRFVTDPDLFAEPDRAPARSENSGQGHGQGQGEAKPAPRPQANLFGELPPPPSPRAAKPKKPADDSPGPKPGRRWKTFAEFVPGPSNRVAHAAALAAAEEPGLGPNPLVIHGPVGTGKTHLLEAVYAGLRRQHPDAKPLYVTAEEFTTRFVQATRFGKMSGFRRQFRECSALLLDDLHFLATKRQTQEEFLHTLDALVADGRQVVVTTDCHPRLAEELMPELVDRLLGGAAWGLLPPDGETRLDILRKKAGLPLSPSPTWGEGRRSLPAAGRRRSRTKY